MSRPMSRTLSPEQVKSLRGLLEAEGHRPAPLRSNRFVAFEVRTEGRSIFTVYTSGKLVTTLREGDAPAALLAGRVDELVGAAPARSLRAGSGSRPGVGADSGVGADTGAAWLAGADETGTGELLGQAIVGGALFSRALAGAVDESAGAVDTKVSRAASGWEKLGEALAGLGPQGLVLRAVPVPNRLFDTYSKNALLDLAYVRLLGDLLVAAPPGLDSGSLELVIDDYGAGAVLRRAAQAWRARGLNVQLRTKADDTYLAVRAASVFARVQRSREMAGLRACVPDGPIGSGNAGHRETRAWLARRARARRDGPGSGADAGGARWPAFVKASFRTVRSVDGLPPVEKRPVPTPEELLEDEAAAAFLAGRLDGATLQLRLTKGAQRRLEVDPSGQLAHPGDAATGLAFLPLLTGGAVLGGDVTDPLLLEQLLDRETGLLSGWRVLVGPSPDPQDPVLAALSQAHRAGIVQVLPTRWPDPRKRAQALAGVLVTTRAARGLFTLRLRT